RRSVPAEIAGRLHDAASKMVLPDAVRHHPGSQGVFGTGNPFGERHASSPCGKHLVPVELENRRLRVAADGARKPWLDWLAGMIVISTNENVRDGNIRSHGWAVSVPHSHGFGLH